MDDARAATIVASIRLARMMASRKLFQPVSTLRMNPDDVGVLERMNLVHEGRFEGAKVVADKRVALGKVSAE